MPIVAQETPRTGSGCGSGTAGRSPRFAAGLAIVPVYPHFLAEHGYTLSDVKLRAIGQPVDH